MGNQFCNVQCDRTPGCIGYVTDGKVCWLKGSEPIVPGITGEDIIKPVKTPGKSFYRKQYVEEKEQDYPLMKDLAIIANQKFGSLAPTVAPKIINSETTVTKSIPPASTVAPIAPTTVPPSPSFTPMSTPSSLVTSTPPSPSFMPVTSTPPSPLPSFMPVTSNPASPVTSAPSMIGGMRLKPNRKWVNYMYRADGTLVPLK